jgi:hypothetical protein
MLNKKVYKEMKKRYGTKSMPKFCLMLSEMYDIIYQSSTKECINEASYERDWWMEKYKKLNKNK